MGTGNNAKAEGPEQVKPIAVPDGTTAICGTMMRHRRGVQITIEYTRGDVRVRETMPSARSKKFYVAKALAGLDPKIVRASD